MALLHTVAVTRYRGRHAVEALGPAASGPTEVPNGWVHVLGEGAADDVLAATVVAGLNEADRDVPDPPVSPAAAAFGAAGDAELAEPGASRVLAEYDGTSILLIGMTNRGPQAGFVLDEAGAQREILQEESARVLGQAIRLALDDATG